MTAGVVTAVVVVLAVAGTAVAAVVGGYRGWWSERFERRARARYGPATELDFGAEAAEATVARERRAVAREHARHRSAPARRAWWQSWVLRAGYPTGPEPVDQLPVVPAGPAQGVSSRHRNPTRIRSAR